jgi:DNA-binding NarL/FixJ family response regulator
MAILLVSQDLMIGSWAAGPAGGAGIRLDVAAAPARALELASHTEYRLVMIDLSTAAGALAELITGLRQQCGELKIVAFGPHVQEQLLDRARELGCDRVLSRGQFHSQVNDIIAMASKI